MKIVVNGEQLEAQSKNLAGLLRDLNHDPALVATAVNEAFVRAADRESRALNEGDRVEILSPRQGG